MALGKKIKIFYDPRGQAIKTVNPDDSFQTVFFGNVTDLAHPENYEPSPWVSFTYDANDNAGRVATNLTPSTHYNTPKSAEIDALGRTIKTTEHDAHYNGSVYQDVVMQYKYDLRGNLLEVTDPNSRIAFTHKYDYANRGLWTQHIDRGISTVNMDVMGKPIEATDAKEAKTLNSYDVLNRPIRLWALDKAGASFSMRQYMIYGDDLTATGYTSTQTKTKNLYGKGWKAFDEAGMVRTEDYDFKGNLIEKTRQVIKDSELLSVFSSAPPWNISPYIVDWTGLPASTLLDSQQFVTTMEYDALNRAMKVTYPEDVNAVRKELIPTYNRAGTLTSVEFDGTEYVKEIAYNAKGQPLLTAYGNGIMTRYVYDENTFRPLRMRSEPYSYTNTANNPTYTYTGGVKQDIAYEYDLIGNIMKLHDRATDCGLTSNPDELDRLFNYDPLYRVISATGRESTNQSANILWGDAPAAGSPNASHCRAYTQTYKYDKLGNMLELDHVASSNTYTRRYVYGNYANNNQLTRIDNGGSTPIVYSDFGYDVNGNMTTSDTSRGYVWDAADQLRAFYIQAGTSEPSIYAQYLYSGGQRVKKIVRTTGGDYEVTVYDGAFEYCKKVSGSSILEKNYSHIEGGVEIRTGTAFPGDISDSIVYQLPDNLGGVNIRLNDSGALIDKEEYYPFGDTSLRTFTYKRYRYVGKEKDSESGLYYYGARYYAAWTCRFISVDPLASDYPFYTSYQYAGNKPINSIDINGMAESGGNGQGVGAAAVAGGQAGAQSGDKDKNNNVAQNDNIDPKRIYTTQNGKKIQFNEHIKPNVIKKEKEYVGTLPESGDKVTYPPGVLHSFEVNGVTYYSWYEKIDGKWEFTHYADKEGNPYTNYTHVEETPPSSSGDSQIASTNPNNSSVGEAETQTAASLNEAQARTSLIEDLPTLPFELDLITYAYSTVTAGIEWGAWGLKEIEKNVKNGLYETVKGVLKELPEDKSKYSRQAREYVKAAKFANAVSKVSGVLSVLGMYNDLVQYNKGELSFGRLLVKGALFTLGFFVAVTNPWLLAFVVAASFTESFAGDDIEEWLISNF